MNENPGKCVVHRTFSTLELKVQWDCPNRKGTCHLYWLSFKPLIINLIFKLKIVFNLPTMNQRDLINF